MTPEDAVRTMTRRIVPIPRVTWMKHFYFLPSYQSAIIRVGLADKLNFAMFTTRLFIVSSSTVLFKRKRVELSLLTASIFQPRTRYSLP